MVPALLYHPVVLDHHTGQHPENRGRVEAVLDLLQERGLWDRLRHVPVAPAPDSALEAVHEAQYLERLRRHAALGGFLTADTPLSRRSMEAATMAAGAAIGAVDAVLDGAAPSAFALVRPPGHHAGAAAGMGFCLINHAAVAARYAVRERSLQRVLLVDFDVHHGNGTQDIFYRDPSVLYFSTHQYPAYPGTGRAEELGEDAGRGTNINVPLPAGIGDQGHLEALERVLAPAARRYRPELILVSAGYDAHWGNTAYLNSIRMGVTVTGFGQWVALLRDLADELCGGRLAFTLEGGYDPTALAWSVDATFRALLREPVEDPLGTGPARYQGPIDDLIEDSRRIHGLD